MHVILVESVRRLYLPDLPAFGVLLLLPDGNLLLEALDTEVDGLH